MRKIPKFLYFLICAIQTDDLCFKTHLFHISSNLNKNPYPNCNRDLKSNNFKSALKKVKICKKKSLFCPIFRNLLVPELIMKG